ncbi:MAG TPA: hypothetical protein VGI82_08165 [Chitinophagaceae bacterium]
MKAHDMLARGWKLYRFANYLQLVYSVVLLLSLTYLMIKRGQYSHYLLSSILPAMVCLLTMAVNNYLNLIVLSNHFPNKSIPPRVKAAKTLIFVLCILFNLMLVMVIIVGASEEFDKENIHAFSFGKTLLIMLVTIVTHWIYILFMQIKMVRLIKSESYRSLNDIINSIGEK